MGIIVAKDSDISEEDLEHIAHSAPPNEEVIKYLNNLLIWAESGRLQSLGYIGELSDGTSVNGWTNGGDTRLLIFGTSTLQYRLNRSLYEDREESEHESL
jgi:hypothetical protein